MTIALIVAAAGEKMVIGKDNDLPWHFSSDLKFFKETTLGHDVLMGRKTYQSIVKRLGKPLPERRNIVLTRDTSFKDDRVTIIHDANEITNLISTDRTLFIIGGASIFEQTLPLADKIYLTYINHEYEGDTFFPYVDKNKWQLSRETNEIEKGIHLNFLTYTKR